MRGMYVPKVLSMDFAEAGIAALLTSLTLRLYQNDYTPGENITSDDSVFTEATFSGYEALADFELEQPYRLSDGETIEALAFEQFNYVEPESSPVTNSVYGYYVVNGDDEVIGAERFEEPVTMDSDIASLPVTVRLRLRMLGFGVA